MDKLKFCTGCKNNLLTACFSKNKARKDGLCNRCKVCDGKRDKKQYNSDYTKKYRKTEKSKLAHKLHYIENKDKYKENGKKWVEKNRDRMRELWRNHAQKSSSKLKHNITEARRRAKKLHATLPGYDKQIAEIYKNRPEGYHVDHIVPLKGKEVCGLHVPWNLQYLTPEQNFKKNNRLE